MRSKKGNNNQPTKKNTKKRQGHTGVFTCTFHEPTGGVGLWMALLLVRTYIRRVVAEAASLVCAFIPLRVSICRDMDGPGAGSASCSRDTDRSWASFGPPRLYWRRTRERCESWDVGLRTRELTCEDFLAPRLLFFFSFFSFLFFGGKRRWPSYGEPQG